MVQIERYRAAILVALLTVPVFFFSIFAGIVFFLALWVFCGIYIARMPKNAIVWEFYTLHNDHQITGKMTPEVLLKVYALIALAGPLSDEFVFPFLRYVTSYWKNIEAKMRAEAKK